MYLIYTIVSVIATIVVLVALLLLWRKDRSIWLIVAMIEPVATLAFRVVTMLSPDLTMELGRSPPMQLFWQLAGLAFAVGLLGYAIARMQKT